jgi:hypothetical protein
LRHALPNLLEGKVIPSVVFLVLLHMTGTTPAVLGALAWSLSAMAVRTARRQTITGILILTTVALVARTIAAVATGSVVIYFIQPTVATCLVGTAFLLSVPLKRPLVERLALDFVPLDADTRSHPEVLRFFRHVSLWWGCTSMINFAITLWLLLSTSPTTFVLFKSFLGPVTTTFTLLVAFAWFRTLMARSGTSVIFAPREQGLLPATAH